MKLLRRKITCRNYGKYYETIFVCSDSAGEYCTYLSQTLRNKYGVYSKKVNCNTFNQLEEETRKELSTAHCIIFVLSDDVIDFCNNVFHSVGSTVDDNHSKCKIVDETAHLEISISKNESFIEMYKYVNEVNKHAIACVIGQGKILENDLDFPQYMGDFERLHRLELSFYNIDEDAKELFDNIRYYYSDRQKEKLDNLTAVTIAEMRYYYNTVAKHSKICLAIIILLILLVFISFYVCESGEEGMTVYYLAAFVPIVVTLILKNLIKMEQERRYKDNVVFIRDSIYENTLTIFERRVRILLIICKCLVYILVGVGVFYCEENETINCIFIALGTLIYLFSDLSYYCSIIQEHINLILNSNIKYVNYLDFAVELRKHQKTFIKKQLVFVMIAMTISGFILMVMSQLV